MSPTSRRAAGITVLICLWAVMEVTANDNEHDRIQAVARPTTDFSKPEPYERYPAGAATFFKSVSPDVFSQPSANMSFERELDFKVGNGIFKKAWVSAPSSTTASDGLGPLYNARACQRCHLKDGRGHPPAANYPDDSAVSMFLRLSIPPQTEAQRNALASSRKAVIPEPVYGGQLQNFAIQGHLPEGQMHIEYEEKPVELADGTVVSLREPTYRITHLNYGPLHPEVMLSPRVAPPMIGLGFLEALAEDDIVAYADPEDKDGDGISGKPNRVWSAEQEKVMLGRFGWKAGQPTIAQQSAGAFSGDIGISTPLNPAPGGDCTHAQADCLTAPHGGDPGKNTVEASQNLLDPLLFYSRNLAVPARRQVADPQVLEGKRLFYESGCIACHRPKYVTPRDERRPEQSFQLIWPYTDLLLHDMGEGLADHRPEAKANGREWRTPPLWGIGLTETVSGATDFLHDGPAGGATYFLHDGRARSLLEAILWHGGEAENAKQRVIGMSKTERAALMAFLNSL